MTTKGKSTLFFSISVILIALSVYTGIFGLTLGGYHVASFGETIKKGLDLQGGISVLGEIVSDNTTDKVSMDAKVERTIDLLQMRINPKGVGEISVQREGNNRIRIDIPGQFNTKEVLDSVTKPGELKFVGPDKVTILTGKDVAEATARLDQQGLPIIELKLNDEGKVKFQEATKKFINQKIAIYMDETLITDPVVNEIIPNGQAVISGSKSIEEAKNQANKINSGALPVTIKTVNVKVVGPTLGETALPNSVKAGIIGIGLVMLFMLLYYRIPGLIANIALSLYAVLVLLVFVSINAVLTLSGIAGFLLTVGMAVDANVLIFERTKEELKSGKSIKASIDAGFHRAMSSILDSNITTLIAAFVLYFLGTGPVKGFALTLIIGVVLSMFTAITVTKFLIKQAANMGWFDKTWSIGTFGVHDMRREVK